MAKPDPAAKTIEAGARYVLITECLQNDFFLNPECRLYLQDEAARRILLAKDDQHAFPTTGAPRRSSSGSRRTRVCDLHPCIRAFPQRRM